MRVIASTVSGVVRSSSAAVRSRTSRTHDIGVSPNCLANRLLNADRLIDATWASDSTLCGPLRFSSTRSIAGARYGSSSAVSHGRSQSSESHRCRKTVTKHWFMTAATAAALPGPPTLLSCSIVRNWSATAGTSEKSMITASCNRSNSPKPAPNLA